MAVCPICKSTFDERAYQLVVEGLGVFDSVACVEEARRRERHNAREELVSGLLEALERQRLDDETGPPETVPPTAAD